MCNLSKIIQNNNELDFKECGEMVLSLKHNIVFITCKFCSDIFMRVPEFQRHLQRQHNDILEFKNMSTDIYSVEELMDLEIDNDNSECEFETPINKIGDKAATPEACDYNNPDLVELMIEFGISDIENMGAENSDHTTIKKVRLLIDPEGEDKQNNRASENGQPTSFLNNSKTAEKLTKHGNCVIVNEVTPMLMSEGADKMIHNGDYISEMILTEDLDVDAFWQELIKIDVAEMAKDEVKHEQALRVEKSTNAEKTFHPKRRDGKQEKENAFKVDCLVTNNSTGSGETRSVLKTSNLLNNISQPLNNDKDNTMFENRKELKAKSNNHDVSVLHNTQNEAKTEHIEVPPISTETATTHSALFKINITGSDISFEDKENKLNADLQKCPQRQREPFSINMNEPKQRKATSKCDNKSYAIAHRSTKKKELFHRMSNVKKRILKSLASDYKTLHQQAKEHVPIKSVETVPDIVIDQQNDEKANKLPINNKYQKELHKQSTEPRFKIQCLTSLSNNESNIKNVNTNRTMGNGNKNALVGSKRSHSPQTKANIIGPCPVKHLKCEKKAETCYFEPPAIKVEEMSPISSATKEVSEQDIADDVELLKTVGLSILIDVHYEDRLPLDEYEQLHEHATKFASFLRDGDLIWHAKHHTAYSLQSDLQTQFKKLQQRTNAAFGTSLTPNELRRIVNLITIWYTKQCDARLLDKKPIPKAYEFFFKLFAYMPKTLRRRFYCEFCEEHFNTENKYNAHRYVHIGSKALSSAFRPKTFKRQWNLDKHSKMHI